MSAAIEQVREWRSNPVKFVRDNFKVEPDPWQHAALMSIAPQNNDWKIRTAFKSCTGAGKSTTLAWIGWYRLSCFSQPGEHPKGAAISGQGWDNLRDNLWAELAKWQARSEFLTRSFQWTKELIFAKEYPKTWFLAARSYAKDADAEAIGRSLSGLHGLFPFLLLDETGDTPVAVGQKAEQIFTGSPINAMIALAGNPTSTTGLLFDVCTKQRDYWKIVTITADPDDPMRTSRVDIDHAREQIKKYGRDNPWVMATILGEFPPSGFNTLLSIEEVESAMERGLREDSFIHAQKRLGIDVARFGDDRTVIFPRQGLRAYKPVEMRGARSNDIAARIMQAKVKWGSELEFVDGTGGYGSGVIDSLIQGGTSPYEIHFSGKAIDNRYYNKRAEMWFNMAEWIKRGGSIPKLPELAKELSTPTYTFVNGKFQVEPKDQIKERLGFSPDIADALCLTFALPEMQSNMAFGVPIQRENVKVDYDPFSDERLK